MMQKYIEGIIKEKSVTTRETEGSSSRMKMNENKVGASEVTILELAEESKTSKKKEEEKTTN